MSAWIVPRETIDVMVTASGARSQEEGDRLGRMLWRENLLSVADRYPHDVDGERPGAADFRDGDVDTYVWTQREVPPVWVAAAIDCYRYQSNEHLGWENSEADRFTQRLRGCFPRVYECEHSAGRETAIRPPWGIDADSLDALAASLASA